MRGTGMKAAVDIGTNSMRLLIVADDGSEAGRWVRVTGLGRGLDSSGALSEDAIARTVEALSEFGREMADKGVAVARAVATSASRDASNRDEFLDRAEQALGIRPEVIPGTEEAELSYRGATLGRSGSFVVVDIGGGSTEFVWTGDSGVEGVSVDIGSVRLTDRMLGMRPVPFEILEIASRHVAQLFEGLAVPEAAVIGVAGTWTSLAAMAANLPEYDRSRVHGSTLARPAIDHAVGWLAAHTIEETEAIPSLDPARAPVILGGAVVAREVMRHLGCTEVTVSEHDLLDGVVAAL